MKNRRLAIIFAIVLVDMLSFSIVLPLLPYLAKDLLQRAPVWSPGVVAGAPSLAMVPYAYKTLCIRPGRRACDEVLETAE